MIVLSFRSKKDKDHLLKKAKEMEEYASEIVECLEEAKHSYDYDEDDEYEYSERGYRGGATSMRSRYGYRR